MPDERRVDPATGEVTDIPSSPFTEFLLSQRDGNCHGELSEHLAALAAAVETEQRQGTLTLKVTMAPDETGSRLIVRDEITAKPPVPPSRPSVFFRQDDGQISRRDPRQMSLEAAHRDLTNPNEED